MSAIDAYIASNRFGLGAATDDLARIAPDPRGWLAGQIKNAVIPEAVKQDMGGRAALDYRRDRKSNRDKAAQAASANMPPPLPKEAGPNMRKVYVAETGARIKAQIETTQPFIERQVMFWSNHLTVSIQKPVLAAIVNRYEVEAIRPHVTGYFRDMVMASARHPAMLMYLDNGRSIGPGSRQGQRREKGLNENYARELMELHTLGVSGGYTQADVIALAKILTGWSMDGEWHYMYRATAHEPGAKTLLGKTYAEAGEQEGAQAIAALCAHPATARHIATRIARYFLADAPAQSDIDALAASFTSSNGHLPTVMTTLINLPGAWTPQLTKIKTPYEYLVAAHRLTGMTIASPQQGVNGLEALNYRTFNAPSPAGEGDTDADWAGPDAVMKRIDWAHNFVQRLPAAMDPLALAEARIGAGLSEATSRTIRQAASGKDGLAFLLLSPEFQRR